MCNQCAARGSVDKLSDVAYRVRAWSRGQVPAGRGRAAGGRRRPSRAVCPRARPSPPTPRDCMRTCAWLCSVAHITVDTHLPLCYFRSAIRYFTIVLPVHCRAPHDGDRSLIRHHGLLQAMFASSIPEIIELVGSRSKYSGELKREHGKRYKFDVYIESESDSVRDGCVPRRPRPG